MKQIKSEPNTNTLPMFNPFVGHMPPCSPRNNPMIAANWIRDDPDVPSRAEQRLAREREFLEQACPNPQRIYGAKVAFGQSEQLRRIAPTFSDVRQLSRMDCKAWPFNNIWSFKTRPLMQRVVHNTGHNWNIWPQLDEMAFFPRLTLPELPKEQQEKLRKMFESVRGFVKDKDITVLPPRYQTQSIGRGLRPYILPEIHDLKIEHIRANIPSDEQMLNGGSLEDIFINTTKLSEDGKYLTFQRGKHRRPIDPSRPVIAASVEFEFARNHPYAFFGFDEVKPAADVSDITRDIVEAQQQEKKND